MPDADPLHIEHEANNKLPFLDTVVIRKHNGFFTSIYRKKTFTGVYLNWNSLTARRYKIGLITCIAERIWRIVSDEEERKVEIEKLKTILSRNEYPADVVNNTLSLFLEKKSKQAKPGEPERFLKLPYVSRKCEDFAFRLKSTVNEHFPQVEFNVAYQAPMTIGKMFPFKDRVKNVEDQSLVVYSLKCKTCAAEYIGKTERILSYRLAEHQKHGSSSSVRQHMDDHLDKRGNTTHPFDMKGVEILDSADNDMKLRIKELLHILDRVPKLNKQLGTQSGFDIKTLLIQVHPQFRTAK